MLTFHSPIRLIAIAVLFSLPLAAQNVQVVSQAVFFNEGPREQPFIRLALPLETDGVRMSELAISVPPSERTEAYGERILDWDASTLTGQDSLNVNYRLALRNTPLWTFDSAALGGGMGQPQPEQYPLPPLSRADFERGRYANLDEDNPAEIVDRVARTLYRRIKITDEPEDFNNQQPLLQDLHRRLTTERRYPLLVSVTLQYYGIAHRLVSGKVASEGEIFENQLWIEIRVGDGWRRLPTVTDADYQAFASKLSFIPCSYDYRAYTFELLGLPRAEWNMRIQPLILAFWESKDAALLKEDYVEALRQLDSALVYVSESPTLMSEKGLVYTEAGDSEEGLRYLQYAIDQAATRQDKAFTLLQMARFYAMADQNEQALEALERSNLLQPIDVRVVYRDRRFKKLVEDATARRRIERRYGIQSYFD